MRRIIGQYSRTTVKKGVIDLRASYSGAYGHAKTNQKVGVSDNYYLRAWPLTNDTTANNLAAKFSIL